MPLISLENHPKNTAVIDIRNLSLTEVANTVFQHINDPQYSSMVLLQKPSSFTDTLKIRLKKRIFSHGYLFPDRLKVTKEEGMSLTALPEGLMRMKDLVQLLGPSRLLIRSYNTSEAPHIDASFTPDPQDAKIEDTRLPYSVTVTMAHYGIGTRILESNLHNFYRTDNPRTLTQEWGWIGTPTKEWYVPSGAICVMRTRTWDSEHKPQVHSAPNRLLDSGPKLRLIAIGNVAGKYEVKHANIIHNYL